MHDPYRDAIEARITELWAYRAWYRTHRWAEWPLARHETDTELRALVRIARKARKAQAETQARQLLRALYREMAS